MPIISVRDDEIIDERKRKKNVDEVWELNDFVVGLS